MARKSNNYKIMWVDKEYHRVFKMEAAMEGKSVLEHSRDLARKAKMEKPKSEFKLGF